MEPDGGLAPARGGWIGGGTGVRLGGAAAGGPAQGVKIEEVQKGGGADDRRDDEWAHPDPWPAKLPAEAQVVHRGHRSTSLVDLVLARDSADPWLVATMSDDGSNPRIRGGATLQLWRPSDLVTGPSRSRIA